MRWIVAAWLIGFATPATADEPRHLTAQPAAPLKEVRSQCVEAMVEPGMTCNVAMFGRVGAVAGHEFFYARYAFMPASGNKIDKLPYTRIVVFESASSSLFRPILVSSDDAAFLYDKPRLHKSGGRTLLHIPATEDGTGNFNRELVYVWENNGWRDVDVTSWLDELQRRLPKGLGALKGIFPDYVTMKASTPIWHTATDSNACPTAGHADITLAWSNDRIVLSGLRISRLKKASNDQSCFE